MFIFEVTTISRVSNEEFVRMLLSEHAISRKAFLKIGLVPFELLLIVKIQF